MIPEERIGNLLSKMDMKIAVAESCTGGLIAKRITDIAGASAYFVVGLVTYSNGAKEQFLAVLPEILAAKGAVSPEVAEAMAEGARKAAGADIGLSVTGIAGPGGGTPEKPVGTVYIGISLKDKVFAKRFFFHGDRKAIREATSGAALQWVIDCLEGKLA
jgi:PncC family amidohydrolase